MTLRFGEREYAPGFPGYTRMLEVDIFDAGRSAEAKALIKDKAFDAQGRPRLTDIALVIYANATVAQANIAEGEQLLEADAAWAVFRDAAERDPHGYNGKKAQSRLEALSK